jgi:hypothetical protein
MPPPPPHSYPLPPHLPLLTSASSLKKFPFERKFLQNEGNMKEINFEGNLKEILDEQRKVEGKCKISTKLVIFGK